MFKLLLTICLALFFVLGVSGQTPSELANKYAHHEVYEIQPGVQMRAKFAASGSAPGTDKSFLTAFMKGRAPQAASEETMLDLWLIFGGSKAKWIPDMHLWDYRRLGRDYKS